MWPGETKFFFSVIVLGKTPVWPSALFDDLRPPSSSFVNHKVCGGQKGRIIRPQFNPESPNFASKYTPA